MRNKTVTTYNRRGTPIEHDVDLDKTRASMHVSDENTPKRSGGAGALHFQFVSEADGEQLRASVVMNKDGAFHFEVDDADDDKRPRKSDPIALPAGAATFEAIQTLIEALKDAAMDRAG